MSLEIKLTKHAGFANTWEKFEGYFPKDQATISLLDEGSWVVWGNLASEGYFPKDQAILSTHYGEKTKKDCWDFEMPS